MLVIVGLEGRVLRLRSPHVFLVVVAADTEGGHGNGFQMMLNTARRPDGVVGGMFEKELPCGEGHFDAGLLYVFGEGAALKKIVEAVAGFSVFVFAVAHFAVLLCWIPFRRRSRNRRSGGMRRYERNRRPSKRRSWEPAERSPSQQDEDRCPPPWRGTRDSWCRRIQRGRYFLNVLEQPVHRVVGVGALVDGLGIAGRSGQRGRLITNSPSLLKRPRMSSTHVDVSIARELRAIAEERRCGWCRRRHRACAG